MKRLAILLAGLIFAAGGFASPVRAAVPVTITINAGNTGYAIPANFVGLSVSRDNLSGDNGYEQLFNPTNDSYYAHLTNLFAQTGIRHIRTISNSWISTDPDPTATKDDVFFRFAQNAGVTSVIYSLHLFNETGPDDVVAAEHIWTTPADRALLESFALDNEPDWANYLEHTDPDITGYATPASTGGYSNRWDQIYTNIQGNLGNPSPAAPFSGPDTGSEYPVDEPNSGDTAVGGVPFTLRFALDHSSKLKTATQHYYGSASSYPPDWVIGSVYYTNDEVFDTADPDPENGNPIAFSCLRGVNPSENQPHNASNYWARVTPVWVSGTTYAIGNIVADPQDNDNFFEATAGGVSTSHPSSAPANWAAVSDPSAPSPLQMAAFDLSASRLTEWDTLYNGALAGAGNWPDGLPYRLTESSPYDNGGGNPGGQVFATALWGLDYFNWWAAHGCAGINPFTRVAQYNSPIWQLGNSDFIAMPYAYGMKAFSLASQGVTINPAGRQISNPDNLNLSSYAVLGTNDLYVTLINKTFTPAGATDAVVTINEPAGFTPVSARYLVLTSGTYGNVTVTNATLGGAIIPTTGSWSGAWTPLPLTNGVCSLTVSAATAVIVDLQSAATSIMPTLSAAHSGNEAVITFAGGALLSATNVAGPYLPVAGATTPYPIPATNTQEFYRVMQ